MDATELGKILDIAENDGKIDQNEIRVLQSIMSRIKPDEMDAAMRSQLQTISEQISAIEV